MVVMRRLLNDFLPEVSFDGGHDRTVGMLDVKSVSVTLALIMHERCRIKTEMNLNMMQSCSANHF